ncbi:MAG: glycoside hydrolase [Proteobacteria bacterium]|nr:glycoside hydrolase [Pseudomonadota bacterium]
MRCLPAAIVVLSSLATLPPAAADPLPAGAYQDLQWRAIGPPRGGRTRAVTGVPGQPNVFYVGAVNGGVWKTDDAGRTWQPIFDHEPTQSIGAIAVAPSDPAVVYVGSGEGLHRPDLSVGDGIYRSADGGRSWQHLGLRDAQQIPDLAVDPRDANRLYAAVLGHPYGPSAERGIYRSTDGGRSWQRVLGVDEHTGGNAVAIDPAHPDTVYATLWEGRLGPWEDKFSWNGTGGGVYKSTDGGTTWRKLTAGLPANLSQVNLAIAPSRPSRLFLSVATTDPGDYASAAGLGIYRSDDGGEHFERITEDPRPALRIGGGDLAMLRVDPKDADVVYSASIVTEKSTDGGRTWASIRGAPGGDDYQNLWISPDDSRVIALVADQGAIVTVNGGRTWSSWFNQPTAQLYHAAVTPTFPYRVCSGQQESGSVCVASRGNDGEITARDWRPVGVIEYGYVAPDPLHPDLIYGAGRTEVTRYHVPTGQVQNVTPVPVRGPGVRADRTEPLLFSPADPHALYYATNVLWKTTDGGEHWRAVSPDLTRPATEVPASVGSRHLEGAEKQRGVIYAVAASPVAADTLWAGTDDGVIAVTRDGGAHWSTVTPPGVGPWSKVTQLEASHFDASVAYASVSRFRLDDLRPYAYRTRDGGQSWQSIAAGLPPDEPVNAVREDPVRHGLLYAATEKSVWVSYDDGDHWESLALNLPPTSMRDLVVHDADLIVATHGRGFWVLDDLSRLRELAPAKLAAPFLVTPAAAVRAARSTWSDTPIPPDEPLAANPPAGAVLEYYLPREARGALTVEVLDGAGALVRRYSSEDPETPTRAELAQGLIPPYWPLVTRGLSRSPGMHRLVWDLRYAAPLASTRGYPISAVPGATPREPFGPLAVPGRYTVRLSLEGKRYEAPLELRPDPRVTLAPEGYLAQYRLASRLATLIDDSTRALLGARGLRAQLKPAAGAASDPAGLEPRLAALLDPHPDESPALPTLAARVAGLYGEVGRADAAPTAAQLAAADALASDLAAPLAAWRAIVDSLPAVNRARKAQKLPALETGRAPPADRDVADEE